MKLVKDKFTHRVLGFGTVQWVLLMVWRLESPALNLGPQITVQVKPLSRAPAQLNTRNTGLQAASEIQTTDAFYVSNYDLDNNITDLAEPFRFSLEMTTW